MTFFNPTEPLLRCKQEALDIQDQQGLLKIQWGFRGYTLLSLMYTRIDQIFVIWGWLTALIFGIAQFAPIDWRIQAIGGSVLVAVAIATMTNLAWFWVRVERLRWVIYCWSGLMLLGISLTDYGIFQSNVWILIHLCPLWLGLSALGYFCTGIGLRSRTFLIAGLLHCVAIPLLQFVPTWQFLASGSVLSGCLLLLAEVQWDMRPPAEPDILTEEQKTFNRQQYQQRQQGQRKPSLC
ncbi:MAG: hypothetical protein ACTS2F_02385 [Thainema sp.]